MHKDTELATAALRETRRWVVAHDVAAVSAWRITLTAGVINAAADVAFLVCGSEKAAALARVIEGPHRPDQLPAQLIAPSNGELHWLVDAPAAARLEGR